MKRFVVLILAALVMGSVLTACGDCKECGSKDGKVVCPEGTSQDGDLCYVTPTCEDGSPVAENGACYVTPVCPDEYLKPDGSCQITPTCPPQYWDGAHCYYIPKCKDGSDPVGNKCYVPWTCKDGSTPVVIGDKYYCSAPPICQVTQKPAVDQCACVATNTALLNGQCCCKEGTYWKDGGCNGVGTADYRTKGTFHANCYCNGWDPCTRLCNHTDLDN